MTPVEIVAHSLSVVAVILTLISYQLRTQKQIILVLTLATSLFIVHYFLMGAYPGAILNIVCIIRNIIYYFKKTVKPLAHKAIPYVLAVIIAGLGALSWTGPETLLVLFGLAINTVFMSVDNPQLLRKSLLLTCTMILIYNATVPSWGGMVNESIAITSAIIGLIRYRKKREA